jgi:hypothetical protein
VWLQRGRWWSKSIDAQNWGQTSFEEEDNMATGSSSPTRVFLAAVCASSFLVQPAWGEQRITQFALVGPIESFTLDSPGDPLSSARIKVHGVEVKIPRNLIIQFPASYATANDAFDLNPEHDGKSGLAIGEIPLNGAVFEASIAGNIVTDTTSNPQRREYVAGLVNIAQNSLATGSGYIREIVNGELHIVADPVGPATQPFARVRINDANERFAPQDPNPKVDARFNVDDENPTVMALNGYPMCIPNPVTPAECPASNRPNGPDGKPQTIFVMGTAGLPAPSPDASPIPPCPACDPTKQAPFVVGDFVTYSGKVQPDGATANYISAFEVIGNVGIFTAPGTQPAYVSIEGSLIGTMGPQVLVDPANPTGPVITQETQDRFKLEGFTTDPSRRVEIYSVDVDSAGTQMLRFMETAPTQPIPFGRFRVIHGSRANALFDRNGILKGAAREVVIRIENGPDCDLATPGIQNGLQCDGKPIPEGPLSANGLVAGMYLAPIEEFIFPENHVMGEPVVPSNFECLPWLLNGSGPLTTMGRGTPPTPAGPLVGRLDPWPGITPPAGPLAIECGPKPKV